MRLLALAGAALVATLLVGEIEFSVPAEQNGHLSITGLEWVYVFKPDKGMLVADLTESRVIEERIRVANVSAYPVTAVSGLVVPESERQLGRITLQGVTFDALHGSQLALLGELRLEGRGGATHYIAGDQGVMEFLPPSASSGPEAALWNAIPPSSHVVVVQSEMVSILSGNATLAFSAWKANCACLPVGGWNQTGPRGASLDSFSKISVASLEAVSGSVRGGFIVAGGSEAVTENAGLARFPLATGLAGCTECEPQTLQLEGVTVLSNVHSANGQRMRGTVESDSERVRLDEVPVEPALLGFGRSAGEIAGTAAVLVGGAGLAARLLVAGIIARSIRQPLNNDRRRHLLAQVQEHPGATFRELVRRSGIPAGTTRHHLTILRRAGLIVEHGHRSTRRFFENHGKFEANWTQVIALREPGLQELHDWIAQQKAPVSQKAAIQNFEPAGWSRSTTQHRLARLVAHGALQVRLQGRLKLYHVPPPTRPPGVVHLAPAPPPAQPPVGLGAPTA